MVAGSLDADTGDLQRLPCLRAACGDATKGNCDLATSASRSQISSRLDLW